MSALELEGRST